MGWDADYSAFAEILERIAKMLVFV